MRWVVWCVVLMVAACAGKGMPRTALGTTDAAVDLGALADEDVEVDAGVAEELAGAGQADIDGEAAKELPDAGPPDTDAEIGLAKDLPDADLADVDDGDLLAEEFADTDPADVDVADVTALPVEPPDAGSPDVEVALPPWSNASNPPLQPLPASLPAETTQVVLGVDRHVLLAKTATLLDAVLPEDVTVVTCAPGTSPWKGALGAPEPSHIALQADGTILAGVGNAPLPESCMSAICGVGTMYGFVVQPDGQITAPVHPALTQTKFTSAIGTSSSTFCNCPFKNWSSSLSAQTLPSTAGYFVTMADVNGSGDLYCYGPEWAEGGSAQWRWSSPTGIELAGKSADWYCGEYGGCQNWREIGASRTLPEGGAIFYVKRGGVTDWDWHTLLLLGGPGTMAQGGAAWWSVPQGFDYLNAWALLQFPWLRYEDAALLLPDTWSPTDIVLTKDQGLVTFGKRPTASGTALMLERRDVDSGDVTWRTTLVLPFVAAPVTVERLPGGGVLAVSTLASNAGHAVALDWLDTKGQLLRSRRLALAGPVESQVLVSVRVDGQLAVAAKAAGMWRFARLAADGTLPCKAPATTCGNCDDGNACTIDACQQGECLHMASCPDCGIPGVCMTCDDCSSKADWIQKTSFGDVVCSDKATCVGGILCNEQTAWKPK